MFFRLFGHPRQLMSAADFRALVERSTVIERDGFGEKVLKTPEGLMARIFRRRRLLTTARFIPYARRFVRNARFLAARGIPTVTVVGYAWCPELDRHVVTYQPLPGSALRACLEEEGASPEGLLAAVATFVAVLHERGVYFRSLHVGNIILSPDRSTLGLIDLADMSIMSGPLDARLRARNFRHLIRYREDAGHLQAFGAARFLECYLEETQLDPPAQRRFLELVSRVPEWSVPEIIKI